MDHISFCSSSLKFVVELIVLPIVCYVCTFFLGWWVGLLCLFSIPLDFFVMNSKFDVCVCVCV